VNRGDVPAVVAAVHLRAATASLEELVGRVDVESILDEVFSRFCVGK
jgi:tRNA modification GTPase